MSFAGLRFIRARRVGGQALTRVNYDFTQGSLPSGLSCARNSAACYKWDGSALTQFAANAPLLFGAEGLWCPGQFQQHIQNNGLAGAVVGQIGSGGAVPTTWSWSISGGTSTSHITTLTPSAGRPVSGHRHTVSSGTVTWQLYPFANAVSPYRPIERYQYILVRGWWRNASGNVPSGANWRWRASIASTDGGAELTTYTANMPAVPTGSTWEPFACAIQPTHANTAFIRNLVMLTNTSTASPNDVTLELAGLDVQISDWPATDYDIDRPVRVIGTTTTHTALTSPAPVVSGSITRTRLVTVQIVGRAAAGRKTGVNQTLVSFGLDATPDLIRIYRRASDAKLCVFQGGVETVVQHSGQDIVLADGATFSATVIVPASAIEINTVRVGAAGDGSAPFMGYIKHVRINPAHPDWVPDAFSFTPYTGVAPGSGVYARSMVVTGITWDCPVSITAPGEYRINGGAWTSTAGQVNDGQTVSVRLTAGAGYGETVETGLTIGAASARFSVSTEAAPSDFALTLTDWPTANPISFTRRAPTNIRVVGITPAETPEEDMWIVALTGDIGLIEVFREAASGRIKCLWGTNGAATTAPIPPATAFDEIIELPGSPLIDRYWIGENALGAGDWTGTITAVWLNDSGGGAPRDTLTADDGTTELTADDGATALRPV